jgi:myosin-5
MFIGAKQFEIWRICAALLHLGNINVHMSSGNDQGYVKETDPSLIQACSLLGINADNFKGRIEKRRVDNKKATTRINTFSLKGFESFELIDFDIKSV